MPTLTVPMPDGMKSWIDEQATSGTYVDAADYVRDLIRRDQQRSRAIASMQKLVDEGLASGVSAESMDDILQTMRNSAA